MGAAPVTFATSSIRLAVPATVVGFAASPMDPVGPDPRRPFIECRHAVIRYAFPLPTATLPPAPPSSMRPTSPRKSHRRRSGDRRSLRDGRPHPRPFFPDHLGVVAEIDGEVVGYAYGSAPPRARRLPRSADVTVYISRSAITACVGRPRALRGAVRAARAARAPTSYAPGGGPGCPTTSGCTRRWGSCPRAFTATSPSSLGSGTASAGGADGGLRPRRDGAAPLEFGPRLGRLDAIDSSRR